MDALQSLKSAGFSHFLIDLTKTAVTKGDFKQIMTALYKGLPLPDTTRFNWKDGFYSKEKLEIWEKAAQKKHRARTRAAWTPLSKSRSFG